MKFVLFKFLTDNMLLGVDWIKGIFLRICMALDEIVYELVASVYEIFMIICNLNSEGFTDLFDGLRNRIYMLLGIIMLFVVSFNLLQMLVDPNKATDSKLGGGSLAKHIFLSLIMLILAPFTFQLLKDAQGAILSENIIEKVILGTENTSSIQNSAPQFSWMLLSSFFYPANGSAWSSSNNYLSTKVKNAYNTIYIDKYDLGQLSSVADDSSVKYFPIVSTIVGIVMIFQLLKFSISVGIRFFKFMFLEIIAPIPIISYMDPGKGEGIFKKYVSEVISTFLDLFLKIATLYLAILLASKAMQMFAGTGDQPGLFGSIAPEAGSLTAMVTKVLIVIALFQFADKIPEIIGSIFGIKVQSGGGFSKALAGAAGFIGGAAIGGAGALAGSAMRGDWQAFASKDENGKWHYNKGSFTNNLKGVGKVSADAIGGTARGGYGGVTSGYKTGLNTKAFGAMGKAGITGIKNQAISSEQSRMAGGFFAKQAGRVDRALGGEYRANRKMEGLDKGIEKAQKGLQTASRERSAMQNMRSVAERQFLQESGMSREQAVQTYKGDFDNKVNEWIKDNGDSNAAFQASMTNYRNEYGNDSFNASSFLSTEATVERNYNDAASKVVSAEHAKTAYKETPHSKLIGDNETRMKRMDATKKK